MPGSSFGESGKCCHRVKQALMTLDKTKDNSAEETKVDSLWILELSRHVGKEGAWQKSQRLYYVLAVNNTF